mgnify:CR=1 FL=1
MNTPVRFNSLTTLRNFLYVIGDSTPNGLFIIANEYRIITKPQIVTFELSYNLIINIQQIDMTQNTPMTEIPYLMI